MWIYFNCPYLFPFLFLPLLFFLNSQRSLSALLSFPPGPTQPTWGLLLPSPAQWRSGTRGESSPTFTSWRAPPPLCFFPAGELRRQGPASVSGGPSLAIRAPRAPPRNPSSIPPSLFLAPPPEEEPHSILFR